MQAIILAAGMGKRLKELTQNRTKCMVTVNGVTLIDRVLHQLEKQNLSRIVIVEGFEGQKLVDYINTLNIKTPIVFVDNPIYYKTNNIYSLALAKDWLCREDTILLESDIIFEDKVLEELIADKRDTLAVVDKYETWMDGTCVELNADDEIVSFVPGKKFDFNQSEKYYKTVNIYKFSKDFSQVYYVPFLEAYQNALGSNEYYEQVLRVITMLETPAIKGKRLNGEKWYEIDDIQDLDIAESLFNENADERYQMVSGRYGGYWRYPKMIDFCYLVNPFYPPQKMISEMKNSFEILLRQYPSGMRVNSLLAAKNFEVHQENIVVGNGAAELIKSLMDTFIGKVGVVRPTFEEYGHRYKEHDLVVYNAHNDNFSYTVGDLKQYFEENPIENLIIINPDNPSGNYIKKEELLELISWCKNKGIKIVVDESFVDFAEEESPTMICQEILDTYKNLYVMKSISKSYGVPGLRLGVLASSDTDVISWIKKDVAIWNINSFGEFYLQIAEKYKKDYTSALQKFKAERKRFVEQLSAVNGIRVIPSQANYMLVEVVANISSKAICECMLDKYNILIKDVTPKVAVSGGQYLRIAIKTPMENDILVHGLIDILKDIH